MNTGSMFAPNFRSPYSVQMNAGVQRQLKPGTVLSLDYVRNVGLHTLLGIDQNHNGDARFLVKDNALAAISATNSSFACGTATTAAAIDCAIAAGATISDYAGNGLSSNLLSGGGFPFPVPPLPLNGNVIFFSTSFSREKPQLLPILFFLPI